MIEVLDRESRLAEFPPARRPGDLVRPSNGGATEGCLTTFASVAGCFAHGLDELRDLLQGGTVLCVVAEQLVLPTLLAHLLPACPPHQALEARGIFVRPGVAEVPGDILQAV